MQIKNGISSDIVFELTTFVTTNNNRHDYHRYRRRNRFR